MIRSLDVRSAPQPRRSIRIADKAHYVRLSWRAVSPSYSARTERFGVNRSCRRLGIDRQLAKTHGSVVVVTDDGAEPAHGLVAVDGRVVCAAYRADRRCGTP